MMKSISSWLLVVIVGDFVDYSDKNMSMMYDLAMVVGYHFKEKS